MTGNQCAIGSEPLVGLGQVQDRYQHLFVVDRGVFEPNDIVGQGRNLFACEGDTHGQVERLLAGDRVVHQIFERRRIAGLAVDKALPSTGGDSLVDQALFIETVPQAFLALVRVVTQLRQQVVRAHKLLEVGQCRVGFDQVLVRASMHKRPVPR